MTCSTRLASALIALSALAAGCDLTFTDQEVQIRPNPDGSLDLLIVYRGLTSPKDTEEDVAKALAVAERALDGRRELVVADWPGHVDLDDPDIYRDLDADTAQFLAGITLEEVGSFLDDQGRLCGYQRFRLPDLDCALRSLNRLINRAVLASVEDGSLERDAKILDARTRTLWAERARSGGEWFSFAGGMLMVDLPFTPEAFDRLQVVVIEAAGKAEEFDGRAALGSLLAHLRHFEVHEDHVSMAFGSPVSGIFRLAVHKADVVYSPSLLNALAVVGAHPQEGFTLEDARALLLR